MVRKAEHRSNRGQSESDLQMVLYSFLTGLDFSCSGPNVFQRLSAYRFDVAHLVGMSQKTFLLEKKIKFDGWAGGGPDSQNPNGSPSKHLHPIDLQTFQ